MYSLMCFKHVMERMRKYLSSNTPMAQDLISLILCDQNCIVNHETEIVQKTDLCKSKKEKNKKKTTFISLPKNNAQTNIKVDNPNDESYTLHLGKEDVNDTAILPKISDLSNANTEHKNAGSTSCKNISTLVKEDIQNTLDMRKKKDKKVNFLQKNSTQTNITDSAIDRACTLQLSSKKNSDNISILPKTVDLPSITTIDTAIHNNVEDISNTSTLQSLSKEDNPKSHGTKKKRSKKALNHSQKNKAHTLLDECNNVLPKMADILNSTTEHENTENTQNIFFNIDYEFHEANHAIIETFALNIYFSFCADDRRTYCLICDKTFQIQWPSNGNLWKHLCRHIKSEEHVRLLSQMIDDDKKFLQDGKVFSKLALARECMRKKNDIIECLLCDSKNSFLSKVQYDDKSLHEHITSSQHQNFKVSWTPSVKNELRAVHYHFRSEYNTSKYRCEFCNYESPVEMHFAKHLRVPHHTTRLAEIPGHAERFKFHFCAACLLLWFGSSESYDRHSEQIEHKHRVIYSSALDHLSEEIIQLLITSNQNAENLLMQSNSVYYDKRINYALYNLVTCLQRYVPNLKAYPFGSRIADLAFPDSDLDIFLDCDNMYEGRNSSHHRCQNLIALIVYYLPLNKMWKVQEVILHSRTPIAKMLHIPSGLTCDISVKNGLAVENTKIIKCFNHAFPPCRKLILFLKRWLRFCNLLGKHLITSYALSWCVIFYLQTLLVFPSISELIKLRNSSWQISGWEVGVSYHFPVRGIDHSFEELLLGFFIFYADFNYKNHIVCPLLGQPLEKTKFSNLSSLPQDMAPYVAYMNDTHTQEKPQSFFSSSLCVQDPFDLSHNVTKAVINRKLNKFQSSCIYSAKVLKKTFPYLKSPLS